MEYREYLILDNQATLFKDHAFDISQYMNTAKDEGVLDQETVEKLKAIVEKETEDELQILKVFIFEIAKRVSYSDFIRVLELWAHKRVAEQRLKQKRKVEAIYTVRKQTDESTRLLDLYSKMKRRVDNKDYPNLPDHFDDITTRAYAQISGCQNTLQRAILANKVGVLTWLQTQLHTDAGERVRILDRFRSQLTGARVVDTAFVDTVYFCKMACTSELDGQFEQAVRYMQRAESSALSCVSPFARTIVHHDRQFIYRRHNVHHQDPSNVEEIIRSCTLGLDSLANIPGDSQLLFKRIFLLNMVQALLGIGTFLEIDPSVHVQESCIKQASSLLTEVERLSHHGEMEKRRKMIFSLCKGRLAELCWRENEALEYVKESKQLSETGAILSERETKSIQAYENSIDG